MYGTFFAYPSWDEVSVSIDHQEVQIGQLVDETWGLVPEFTMPAVSEAGPFHFYAAMFEPGYLAADNLVSNGAAWEFRLR